MATRLFVGGLPWAVKDEDLKAHFEQAGTVVDAKVITERNTGRSKGFGFVEMSTEEEAAAAIKKFDGSELEGRQIVVNEAKPREDNN